MDPPEHTEERRLVAGDFSVRRIELMRPKIQALVDRWIEVILSKPKEADLITDFAGPVPCGVICTLMGVPEKTTRPSRTGTRNLLDEHHERSRRGHDQGILRQLPDRSGAPEERCAPG
jgi:cytochrome P450